MTGRLALLLLAAAVSAGAIERRAHAYHCGGSFYAHIGVNWAGGGTGIVPVGGEVVMVADDGDCKNRFSFPTSELKVSAARRLDGPYEQVEIRKAGKLFGWRPASAGLWFLRIERVRSTDSGLPATAIVFAHPPKDLVRVRLAFDGQAAPPRLLALFPIVGPEADRARATLIFPSSMALPRLVLKRPATARTISALVPRGSYRAGEVTSEVRRLDDDRQPPSYTRIDENTRGQRSGAFEIAASGEVRLELHTGP